jgi:inorganic pyrophosphatase
MADFNVVLTPGDWQNGLVNSVIDIPLGSTLKMEWDRERACFFVDRVEPAIYPKPSNYGFIPQTLDEDGDELDTLVYCNQPIPTGTYLECRVLGILNFEDDGEMDYKIVCVPADDRDTGDSIKTLEDLGKRWQQKIEEHFTHYKDLKKPGTTKVLGWGGPEDAQKVIKESADRWQSKS